jgi:DNA polymerase-3 subunit chi
MTEVAFHFNAPQKLAYACRLLRKAYLKGAQLVVLVPDAQVGELDQALWLMAPGEFVPHSVPGDPPAVQVHSPIRLVTTLPDTAGPAVLLNLRDEAPQGFERFDRVIDVVSLDDDDRRQARQRWRQYVAAGVEPQRHDLQASPAA